MLDPKDVLYGLSVKHIASVCNVDITTARRWKRGAICPPRTALAILTGDLGFLDPAWRGWSVRQGQLVSPEGWTATVGEVLSLPLMRSQIRTYQAESRAMKRVIERIQIPDEQPMPSDEIPSIIVK